MNKIELLKNRRQKLLGAGEGIRGAISALTDENSFVELDAYSFSQSDYYDGNAEGEGVVTGYATIDDLPVYIAAQNCKVLSGGVSYANCEKIKKCIEKARLSGHPVVFLFDSLGVRVGEGVNALEGIADILSVTSELKGELPLFSVVMGKLYGSFALVAANCDYTFMLNDSLMCYNSPLVISASSGKNLKAEEVAGAKAVSAAGAASFTVSGIAEVRAEITEILNILPAYSDIFKDTDDDLNRSSDSLDEKVCPNCLVDAIFDNGKFLELNGNFAPEVKTGIGRIGGVSAAALVFGGGEEGVYLGLDNVLKIKDFASFAANNDLPLVILVNTLGIKADLVTAGLPVMKEIGNMISALKCADRLSVVYGKAIGLGYSLFASRAMGTEYSYAFANAKIALFDGDLSSVYFGEVRQDKFAALSEKYSLENADPINAAKNGYIDNIIEPRFVRQYVISALQMMRR